MEETLETDNDQRSITLTSFTPKSSTLSEIETSSSITASTTAQSSTSLKSTSRLYTIWYPFIETTSSTDKSFNFLSSSSDTTISSNIGGSTTESTPFVTDVSAVYSVTSKEISQTETVSLEPRTFPSVSSEVYSVTSPIKVETEYLTQKSIHNETTTTEIIYQENGDRMFTSTGNTTPESSSTTRYVPSTG